MWLLVLILSIKIGMPTWYGVIFTIISILRPLIIKPIEIEVYKGVYDKTHNK